MQADSLPNEPPGKPSYLKLIAKQNVVESLADGFVYSDIRK